MGLVEAEGAGRRQRTGALTHVVLDADVLLSTYNPRERYATKSQSRSAVRSNMF